MPETYSHATIPPSAEDIEAEGAALAERLRVVPLEHVFSRPGTHFLHALEEGEQWMVHPSGYGIIVARPAALPMWIRVVDGAVVKTVIEPLHG